MNMVPRTLLSRKYFAHALVAIGAVTLAGCAPAGQMSDSSALADDETDESTVSATEGQQTSPELAQELGEFGVPNFTESESEDVMHAFSYVDPQGVVPTGLKATALQYFASNRSRFANSNYVTVVDFSKRSSEKRMFVINLSTGIVWSMHVAHGKGSDRNSDGYAESFSNMPNSKASSLGMYRTANTYSGSKGFSLRLQGLSSTNSNVMSRAVVVHGAAYVQDSNVTQGRSWGCFAVSMDQRTRLINTIKNGSLIYAGLSR